MGMRIDRDERKRAEQLSATIDRVLSESQATGAAAASGAEAAHLDAADADLLDTARRLACLPALLGPVDPALEQRVMRQVRAVNRPAPRFRLGWAIAGLAAVLVLVLLVTPLGGAAVASFRAVFDLGRTDIEISQAAIPTVTAGPVGVRQSLSFEEAQDLVAFEIPQPAYLPSGYDLLEVYGHSYPDLPAWLPQPFFVELIYGDGAGGTCNLRAYPIVLGSDASISGLNLEATSVEKVQDLVIGGQPGVLLNLGGGDWQEVVWEHRDLILALSSDDLAEAELLQVARSVGQ
jgi:hypothetical protein